MRAAQLAEGGSVASVRSGGFLSAVERCWHLFCLYRRPHRAIDLARDLGDKVTPETLPLVRDEVARAQGML